MQSWIQELRQLGPPNLVLAIAGNKLDISEARQVWRQGDEGGREWETKEGGREEEREGARGGEGGRERGREGGGRREWEREREYSKKEIKNKIK